MPLITALISGIIFGIGLAMGGMLDPAKVVGFLNIGGPESRRVGEWECAVASATAWRS